MIMFRIEDLAAFRESVSNPCQPRVSFCTQAQLDALVKLCGPGVREHYVVTRYEPVTREEWEQGHE